VSDLDEALPELADGDEEWNDRDWQRWYLTRPCLEPTGPRRRRYRPARRVVTVQTGDYL